jgi:aspartyl/glutamyl-tRNA(Asn/Gln) amidotransferase C subunit
MEINIKKYAQISYIAINETEQEDIKKGVLDILNYVYILNNITVENNININNTPSNSTYRISKETVDTNQYSREILFGNAPQLIKNYFIVPDLIIRKS